MNYNPSEITIQTAPSSLSAASGSAMKTILRNDPGLILQLLLVLPIVTAGVLFNLNAIQWVLVSFVTLIYLVACVVRTAALLQIKNDDTLNAFQVSRIKCMGNAILTITAGLSLITYLLVFVPVISQLL